MPELKNDYPNFPQLGMNNSGDVLMVFAHPDDELQVIAQYAQIYHQEKARNPPRRFRWILVSDAGLGKVLPLTCLGKSKSACRAQEANDVASCFDVPAPEQMNLPDGGLAQVQDLAFLIQQKIDQGGTTSLAAIFSSDDAGLYGHPDHLAVHDVMWAMATKNHVPYISGALPKLMEDAIPLREPALSEHRVRPLINMKLDLDPQGQSQMACAARAHHSQALLILGMMQFLLPTSFYETVPRVFLNYSPNK